LVIRNVNVFKELQIEHHVMIEQKDSDPIASSPERRVRSFVRRGGRVTRAQERALLELWPRYGVELHETGDLAEVFGREAPRYLEIGFGMGDALAQLARERPQHDFLGVDVHEAGIGRVMTLLEGDGAGNVRILRGDAVELLRQHLAPASLQGIMVFFPDPWPKKRHHKRRLVTPAFLRWCARVVRRGGVLHLATDWEPYARAMLEIADAAPGWRNLAGAGHFADSRAERPQTRFERRGQRLGHSIFDLCLERSG
jgi:tRNA (guanine-N7-)-methyltransferase